MTMDSEFIITDNLCRYYGRGDNQIHAVDHVDLTVARGEFLAVVGSSGSGKSTLLNLLAGLDTPTAGAVRVAGFDLGKLSRRELSRYRACQVGMIFQTFNLLSHHTALKNVEIALYFQDVAPADRRRRAEEMLVQVGLGDRLNHRPTDMSGGEQQRVAIARALVKKPEVIFADEPTGNLDLENSRQIAALLSDLNRQGLTVIMVTHALDLAQSISHRVVKMYYGKLVEELPAEVVP